MSGIFHLMAAWLGELYYSLNKLPKVWKSLRETPSLLYARKRCQSRAHMHSCCCWQQRLSKLGLEIPHPSFSPRHNFCMGRVRGRDNTRHVNIITEQSLQSQRTQLLPDHPPQKTCRGQMKHLLEGTGLHVIPKVIWVPSEDQQLPKSILRYLKKSQVCSKMGYFPHSQTPFLF